MNLLGLAFADGAFKEEGIRSPEDLYKLGVPDYKGALRIGWRRSILERPIFRRANNMPFTASDFNHYLKQLGCNAGYPQTLTSYALRRGAANAFDRKTYCDPTLLPFAEVP